MKENSQRPFATMITTRTLKFSPQQLANYMHEVVIHWNLNLYSDTQYMYIVIHETYANKDNLKWQILFRNNTNLFFL